MLSNCSSNEPKPKIELEVISCICYLALAEVTGDLKLKLKIHRSLLQLPSINTRAKSVC